MGFPKPKARFPLRKLLYQSGIKDRIFAGFDDSNNWPPGERLARLSC
jgi:hypothetical protein